MSLKYPKPSFIPVTQSEYQNWLSRKSKSIVSRFLKKDNKKMKLEEVKIKVHEAIYKSDGVDFYTGEKLDWHLIGKYDGKKAKEGGLEYHRKFALLPAIDHYQNRKLLDFVVCGWTVNDAKNYLSHVEFVELCRKVLRHYDNKIL